MKSNKLMKLLLSLLMVLTIACTNAEIISTATFSHYDSQIQLLREDFEDSPLDELGNQ